MKGKRRPEKTPSMLGVLTVSVLLFFVYCFFFVLCFLLDKLEDLIGSCYTMHCTHIIALLLDDEVTKSKHCREEPVPDNINFYHFFYINHFYIFLKKKCAINNDNFFWNNDNNLVEVANESQYEFHESVVHEQYTHWE